MKRPNYALGHLKTGQMNQTEMAYSEFLEVQKEKKLILWYKFEGIKFRLGENCYYTPDFAVMTADGTMQMHEVKGFWMDDARVKIKIAAETYPFQFIAVKPRPKKLGGGWDREEF